MKPALFQILSVLFLSLMSQHNQAKVAVIGSGIGGLSSSYFLMKNYYHYHSAWDKEELVIDVFESEATVGGRMNTQKIITSNGNVLNVDVGASFFIKENLLLFEIIEFTETEYIVAVEKEKKNIAILNNKLELVITLDSGFYYNMYKLVSKFKFGIMDANTLSNRFYETFLKVYDYLDAAGTDNHFTSFESFVNYLDIRDLVMQTTEKYFEDKLNKKFVEEFLQPLILSCFNQDKNINAYAGSVILAALIKVGHVVKGGYQTLINNLKKELISQAKFAKLTKNVPKVKFDIQTNMEIVEVSKHSEKYCLHTINHKLDCYDYIILGLGSFGNIRFNNFKDRLILPKFDHQDLYELVVEGELNNQFLGLDKNTEFSAVLFTELLDSHIGDIVRAHKNVYKIQVSGSTFDEAELRKFFYDGKFHILHKKHWIAPYPILKPIIDLGTLANFKISNGERIYNVNVAEQIASCIEVIVISSKSISNSIASDLKQKYQKHSSIQAKPDL